MKYKNSILIGTLMAILIVLGSFFTTDLKRSEDVVNLNDNKVKTILIDPGHGGMDGGASASDGTVEKHINLNIALELEKLLKESGYNVYLTRYEDTGLYSENGTVRQKKNEDLNARCQLKKETNCDLFVSIHLNKFKDASCKGAQVWYSNNPESEVISKIVQNNLKEDLDTNNKRQAKPAKDAYKILRTNDTMPGFIIECGFLSNNEDLSKLKDESYQKKVAQSLFKSIEYYYKNGTKSK